jgi:hypothetical protein
MFAGTHLIGFAAGGSAATRTFLQKETTQVATQSTYTFTNANIGAEAGDRYVVVVFGTHGLAGRTVSSITIGGNAATIHANSTHNIPGNSTHIAVIAGLLVPSGTTATMVINLSGTAARCWCFVYALHGLASTTQTAAATEGQNAGAGDTISDTIDIPSAGILITAITSGATLGTHSWSGATEDSDENNGNIAASVASLQGLSAETARAYSATISNSCPKSMAAAAWN